MDNANAFTQLVKNQNVRVNPEDQQPETTEKPEPQTEEAKSYRQPSREGTKPFTLHLPPDAHRQLKMLALEEDVTMHDILISALNVKFEIHNKPPIA